MAQTVSSAVRQDRLRLWPGVAIVVLQWLVRFGLPMAMPDTTGFMIAMMGGMLGGVAAVVWWTFFSRASRKDRWAGSAVILGVMVADFFAMHPSIRTGMMGMMYFMYVMPGLGLALVAVTAAARRLPLAAARIIWVAAVVLACSVWLFARSNGIDSLGGAQFVWRWAPTAEGLLLEQESDDLQLSSVPGMSVSTAAIWPGFRGPKRDSVIYGTRIASDWAANPPEKLWSQKVGPACSSFAVQGKVFFTQEQRGKYEMVSCYNLDSGKPVWRHKDKERFWDSHAGAGPRSTPTLYEGRVYTFGPTGILNVLEAGDGTLVWTRHVGKENHLKLPQWALTSSPLIAGDKVIVAAEGTLMAFDRATGEVRWRGPEGGKSYSSPHLATLDGVEQVLMLCGDGVISVDAEQGDVNWKFPLPKGEPIVQPAILGERDLLVASGDGFSLHRITIRRGAEGWTMEKQWTTSDLKPYFNDFVIHKGHAYGFDAPALACIRCEDGKPVWRGGRYGGGQLMLLADQDLLLVISEQGELALVKAVPDAFTELSRLPGIEGRVWNHHVLVGDVLLLRNSEAMAAYRLQREEP